MNNRTKRQFAALYATNFWGVMNDNLLKTLVCFIAALWVDEEYKQIVVNLTAGALVLPYLFFSPLAGKLPQYCNKLSIVRWAKLAELPIMTTAIAGFITQSIGLAMVAVLLMGLQSALFSPSKYGLIKDIGGLDGISQGMGGMEAIAFLGILIGTVAASFLADGEPQIELYCSVLVGLAVLGVICSMLLKVKEERVAINTSANPITFISSTHKLLKKYRGMNGVIHILSVFWWLSASIQTILIIYCDEALGMSSSQTGILLATTAIGISVGCVVGGMVDKRKYLLGAVPLLGLLLAVLLFCVFIIPMGVIPFGCCIFAVAFFGGMFKIPLDAEIQKRVDSSELNVVLAYFNLISFVYIFASSATNIAVTALFSSRYVFLAQAVVMVVASMLFLFNYRSVLCYFGRIFMRMHYKVEHVNRQEIELSADDERNLLVLPSHRAVVDPLMLFAEWYDLRMQPLVDDVYFRIPVIGHVLNLFDAVEVPDLHRSRQGIEKVKELNAIVDRSLAEGKNIFFYPSGRITLDGRETIGANRQAYCTCQNLTDRTKVVGVRIVGLWGSRWSRYGLSATPSLVKLLLQSGLQIITLQVFFKPKRCVRIEYEDLTERVGEWRNLPKMEFNRRLEEFYARSYGADGREAVV